MINSDFIIRYTNALYSTSSDYSPRYDEFRDMFSSGQIYSKQWLVQGLLKFKESIKNSNITIVGAWFGTLGLMIKDTFPNTNLTMLDIDPRCENYINNIIYNIPNTLAITGDMYTHKYTDSDVIINTSCEHIDNLKAWISLLPKNKTVVLQSNNFKEGSGHINCVDSIEGFISNTDLKETWLAEELVMPMYTRYMIIGRT